MQRDEDEDAWRSIIENYGDRAELDDEPPPPSGDPGAAGNAGGSSRDTSRDPFSDPFTAAPPPPSPPAPPEVGEVGHPDSFVPPDPPLPPTPTRDRQAAWIGLIGSPALVMILLVASVRIPSLLAYALIAAFVGGFLYLVFHLPRNLDDPFDDGARL